MESIKRQLLDLALLIVFPASRIHCSVEWSLLLSLGHRVSAVDLHTLTDDETQHSACLHDFFDSHSSQKELKLLKKCLTSKKHQAPCVLLMHCNMFDNSTLMINLCLHLLAEENCPTLEAETNSLMCTGFYFLTIITKYNILQL